MLSLVVNSHDWSSTVWVQVKATWNCGMHFSQQFHQWYKDNHWYNHIKVIFIMVIYLPPCKISIPPFSPHKYFSRSNPASLHMKQVAARWFGDSAAFKCHWQTHSFHLSNSSFIIDPLLVINNCGKMFFFIFFCFWRFICGIFWLTFSNSMSHWSLFGWFMWVLCLSTIPTMSKITCLNLKCSWAKHWANTLRKGGLCSSNQRQRVANGTCVYMRISGIITLSSGVPEKCWNHLGCWCS